MPVDIFVEVPFLFISLYSIQNFLSSVFVRQKGNQGQYTKAYAVSQSEYLLCHCRHFFQWHFELLSILPLLVFTVLGKMLSSNTHGYWLHYKQSSSLAYVAVTWYFAFRTSILMLVDGQCCCSYFACTNSYNQLTVGHAQSIPYVKTPFPGWGKASHQRAILF